MWQLKPHNLTKARNDLSQVTETGTESYRFRRTLDRKKGKGEKARGTGNAFKLGFEGR
jgi:hypothetical protein